MKRYSLVLLALSVLMAYTGCEKKDNTVVTPPSTSNPTFTTTNVKDGAVYFSFDDQKESPQWDVKFGEYAMPPAPGVVPMPVANPGFLGDQYVTVFNSKMTSLAALVRVSVDSLKTDPMGAILSSSWYDYNPATHTISSNGSVYVMKGANGKIYKFRIDDYSNKVFTVSHAYRLTDSTWSAVQTSTVDISGGEKFLSFAMGTITPANWDVKLTVMAVPSPIGTVNFPGIALNREKNVLAKIINGANFDVVNAKTETGLTADIDTMYVIGTACLSYDENTHHLSPYDNRTFVISTTAGNRVKLRMLSYYNDNGASGYMKFEYVLN